MVRTLAIIVAGLGLLATLVFTPGTLGLQHDHEHDATPATHGGGMSGTGAAYMVIRNAGSAEDRLLGGETDVAEVVEIHEVIDDGGVMSMRPLMDGLEIPAGGETILEPGGYHVMLIGLTRDLRDGDAYELTLTFEDAGEITVPIQVRPREELADDATPAAPVASGEITVEGGWSRPAPAFGGMEHAAATPTG